MPAAPVPAPEPPVPAIAAQPGPELLWRYIGSHEARLDQLESGAADTRHELKEVRAEVQAVQAHLVRQDTSIGDIAAGIAALQGAGDRAAENHRSTMHAIKLAAVSTMLSALVGLGVTGIEHMLPK